MQHRFLRDNREQAHTPSLQFVCSVARLLQSDPTDLLRELGYSPSQMETALLIDERLHQPLQEQIADYSGYYLG